MLRSDLIRQSIENLKVAYPDLLDDSEMWLSALESETSFNEMLISVVKKIEDAKALIVGTQDRLEELKARKDRFEFRIEGLRELAFKLMNLAELKKVELPLATLSIRAGQPQLIGEAFAADLPDHLCKISRDLNRTAIKEALKAGQTVPGFQLSNSQPTLSIRIK